MKENFCRKIKEINKGAQSHSMFEVLDYSQYIILILSALFFIINASNLKAFEILFFFRYFRDTLNTIRNQNIKPLNLKQTVNF